MPSVAEQLRHAREAQGLSIYQIADLTKIRTDHIRALEEGNYNVFAAPVYIRGFVRNYGTVLKLNVGALLKDLDGELAGTDKFNEPPSLTGRRQGALDYVLLQLTKINWRIGLAVIVLGGLFLIALGAYRVWHNYVTTDPLEDLGSGIYEPQETNQNGEILPFPEDPN